MWIDLLRQLILDKGPRQVARELGISHSTLSLIMSGKYNASTKRIEERVGRIYGNGEGGINCPVLGEIQPSLCAEKWNLAKRIGGMAGNPETLKLYKACMKCAVRK